MMQQAFVGIGNSDLLIAEVSEKASDAGIEIGYAVAAKKPVIYVRNARAEHSASAAFVANHVVFFEPGEDLTKKIIDIIPGITG